jgi:uncharacterized Zn finger protein
MRSGSNQQGRDVASRGARERGRRSPAARELHPEPVAQPFWSLRWVEALLKMSAVQAARLERGYAYARGGHVRGLMIEDGKIKATVRGARPKPYEISLQMAPLDDATWERAVEVMRARPDIADALLTGEPDAVPRSIDEIFRPLGVSLFPVRETDLLSRCSCPDWAVACKHVAAVHCQLAQVLDRDPFLLFELRGRTKEQLLEALRAGRKAQSSRGGGGGGGGSSGAGGEDDAASAPSESSPSSAPLESGAPSEPSGSSADVAALDEATFERRTASLSALRFDLQPTSPPGAILRPLGQPHPWSRVEPIESWLNPTYQAASEAARSLALRTPK